MNLSIQDHPLEVARSLTILNEMGDVTIEWDADKDADMEAYIDKQMKAGVVFYTIPGPRKPGQKGRIAGPKKLTNAAKAREFRALTIKDDMLSKMVADGRARVTITNLPAKIEGKRATTPKEVASGRSVGVRARQGG